MPRMYRATPRKELRMELVLIILICLIANIVSFRLGYKSGKDKEIIVVKQSDDVTILNNNSSDLSYEDEEAIVPDETEVKTYV